MASAERESGATSHVSVRAFEDALIAGIPEAEGVLKHFSFPKKKEAERSRIE